MVLFVALLHLAAFCVLGSNLVYLHRRRRPGAPPHWPRLTVLIPARNEAANLRRLLPTLRVQDYPSFEVIVYDDASEDETWAVLQSAAAQDAHLHPLRGAGPPPGWVGKVHALYQATRTAQGDLFLFLDADARLEGPGALRRLVGHWAALPTGSALSGLTRLRGGGLTLVSLVPGAILYQLPWALVPRVPSAALAALNGQCWMLDAATYRRLEPHAHVAGEVLEDVEIGRYLKRCGVFPALADVQGEVEVYMYDDLKSAWRGFRKNAYLIMGGHPLPFLAVFALHVLAFVAAPLVSPWFLLSLYVLKGASDRRSGMPFQVTLLTPFVYALATLLQLDSAFSHLTNRVSWKGRQVG